MAVPRSGILLSPKVAGRTGSPPSSYPRASDATTPSEPCISARISTDPMRPNSARSGGQRVLVRAGTTFHSTAGRGSAWDVSSRDVVLCGLRYALTRVVEQYALTEASYTVLRILQKYESIEPADNIPYEKVPLVSSLTTAPALATVRLQKAA
jgi:hypothetical protein